MSGIPGKRVIKNEHEDFFLKVSGLWNNLDSASAHLASGIHPLLYQTVKISARTDAISLFSELRHLGLKTIHMIVSYRTKELDSSEWIIFFSTRIGGRSISGTLGNHIHINNLYDIPPQLPFQWLVYSDLPQTICTPWHLR